jgi:hypothetical protein
MPGKAAGSPAYWRYTATEDAATVDLRGPGGNVQQRGTSPWGAHQRDRANARDFGHATLGPASETLRRTDTHRRHLRRSRRALAHPLSLKRKRSFDAGAGRLGSTTPLSEHDKSVLEPGLAGVLQPLVGFCTKQLLMQQHCALLGRLDRSFSQAQSPARV